MKLAGRRPPELFFHSPPMKRVFVARIGLLHLSNEAPRSPETQLPEPRRRALALESTAPPCIRWWVLPDHARSRRTRCRFLPNLLGRPQLLDSSYWRRGRKVRELQQRRGRPTRSPQCRCREEQTQPDPAKLFLEKRTLLLLGGRHIPSFQAGVQPSPVKLEELARMLASFVGSTQLAKASPTGPQPRATPRGPRSLALKVQRNCAPPVLAARAHRRNSRTRTCMRHDALAEA